MQQKTSYFNKTIFMKNITHYWPIWAIYSLFCVLILPFSLFMTFRYATAGSFDQDAEALTITLSSELLWGVQNAITPAFVFIAAILAAIAVFSYLYNGRSTNMIHALPVNRRELFITNYLSGLLFLIVPQLIAFVSSVFVCLAFHVTHAEYLLKGFLLVVGIAFFAYSLAVFTVMITGNIIAAPIYFFVINFIFMACKMAVNFIISAIAYGFSNSEMFSGGNFLSPIYFLTYKLSDSYYDVMDTVSSSNASISGGKYVAYYAAVAILFIVFAWILYKNRHLETAGDIISVQWLKPIFRWVSALIGSILLTALLYSFLFMGNLYVSPNFVFILLLVLICGFFIFFIAEMLLEKSFRVFKKVRLIEWGVYSAIVFVFLGMIEFDTFGQEKKVPDTNDIVSASVYGSYQLTFTDSDDLSQVTEFHKQIVNSKNDMESFFKQNPFDIPAMYVDIRYELKNGSILRRSYRLPATEQYLSQDDSLINGLQQLEEDPEHYLTSLFSTAYHDVTMIGGTYEFYSKYQNYESKNLSAEQSDALYRALIKDIESGNFKLYEGYMRSYEKMVYENSISFEFKVPSGADYTEHYSYTTTAKEGTVANTYFKLTVDCENTINELINLKLIRDESELTLLSDVNQDWATEEMEEETVVE